MSRFKPRIEERRFEDIGTWMLAGQSTELPEPLRGVFYMDGNPLPEHCLTFQRFVWNAETRRIRILMYRPSTWTFESSKQGRTLLKGISITRACLDVRFEDDALTKAKVVPLMFGLPIPPKFILQFLLLRDSAKENTWDRKNRILFQDRWNYGSYTLRRVLYGDGQPTDWYDKMMDQVPETCLVIAEDGSES